MARTPKPKAAEAAEQPAALLAGATPTKQTHVLALLRRDEGATLAELIAVTGWLPHSTRAALTGLRKKRYAIVTGKRGDTTCYSIAAA